jgi:hypothetical protein
LAMWKGKIFSLNGDLAREIGIASEHSWPS